jgi:plasmid stability protein
METTLEVPDDLTGAVKVRAAPEGRRLKDVMAEVVRRGVAQESPQASGIRHRLRLVLITGGHPAPSGDEMSLHRIHEILLQQEADAVLGPSGPCATSVSGLRSQSDSTPITSGLAGGSTA